MVCEKILSDTVQNGHIYSSMKEEEVFTSTFTSTVG